MPLSPIQASEPLPDRLQQLKEELAHRIAACIGSEQKRITAVPGLTVHQRTAPTPPCSMTYEPSLILTAQGRKRVEFGGKPTYGTSHYLVASVALPVVARVVEASQQTPCLGPRLKLQMPVVRELLGREELAVTPHSGKARLWPRGSHLWTCWILLPPPAPPDQPQDVAFSTA
ncbi:MAG: AraC family transcriptional regulator [Bryobacterales bacterium]|nr:AraC family transcriptional regulator [Bryobacterales bacterium]